MPVYIPLKWLLLELEGLGVTTPVYVYRGIDCLKLRDWKLRYQGLVEYRYLYLACILVYSIRCYSSLLFRCLCRFIIFKSFLLWGGGGFLARGTFGGVGDLGILGDLNSVDVYHYKKGIWV